MDNSCAGSAPSMDGDVMPVTQEQAQQLASLARAIRPFGASRWQEAGVMAAIGVVKALDLAEVAMVVIQAAADRRLDTPAAIGNTRSPLWQGRWRNSTKPQTVEPYDKSRFCHVCGRTSHAGPSDHEFETVIEHDRKLARMTPKPPLRTLIPTEPEEGDK